MTFKDFIRKYKVQICKCLGVYMMLFALFFFTWIDESVTTATNASKTPSFISNPDITNYVPCFKTPSDIETFVKSTKKWKHQRNKFCIEKFSIFSQIFEVTERYSREITIPDLYQKILLSKLGKDIVSSIHKQHIIHIFNRLTFEHSVYNPLRAKRPIPPAAINVFQYIHNISTETKPSCKFCKYKSWTAVDELGRHEKLHTVRLANKFALDRWHGVVISRYKHNPHELSMLEFLAFFEDGNQWVDEIHKIDPQYIYPVLTYDTFYKSGASQIHPHMHVLLSADHQYGAMYQLQKLGEDFLMKNGQNLFTNLAEIYSALGLTIHLGDAVAFPTLVGRTDLEMMFISDKPSEHLYRLLYITIKTLEKRYQNLCYSVFHSLAPLSSGTGSTMPGTGSTMPSLPTIIRLYPRGDCVAPRNDIGSHELNNMNYRDHDPWKFVTQIREIAALSPHDDV